MPTSLFLVSPKGSWRDLATAPTIVLQPLAGTSYGQVSGKALHTSAVFPSAPLGSVFSCTHCTDAQIKAETGSGLGTGEELAADGGSPFSSLHRHVTCPR